MEFRHIFKDLLKSAGMTQAEFCERSGMSKSYVSELSTGKISDPSFSKVQIIADTFGITLNELMQMQEQPERSEKLTECETELLDYFRSCQADDKRLVLEIAKRFGEQKSAP